MSDLSGLEFFKMSGSGNDFVVVDARKNAHEELRSPEVIQRLSARGTGVGADGLVLLAAEPGADFRMIYYNADGSRASMCGNAALCCTRLATELAGGSPRELRFATDSGIVSGRVADRRPEIDLAPVSVVRPDASVPRRESEERIGYAVAGVPHLTVLVEDLDGADVAGRGRALRFAPEVGPEGANANFVAREGRGWAMRTYERGVEAETLACGTGAVASAILIQSWGLAAGPVELRTRSGRVLSVRLRREGDQWMPTLAGEGRIVFRGRLAEL
ncbi:MAG TPA: diaminopimelate epimerase [Gemmatimonadaceae bacterium]|nr:diaminopimelate epimerase [Gemmatimonadaceae bacterium]